MDDIIEFIVEVLLDALMMMLKSEKVPYFVRFIIYLLSSAFLWFLAIFAFIFAFKIKDLMSMIILLLGCILLWIWYKMSVSLNLMRRSENKLSDNTIEIKDIEQ